MSFDIPSGRSKEKAFALSQSNCRMPQSGLASAEYFGSATIKPGQRYVSKPCAAKGSKTKFPCVSHFNCLLRRSPGPRLGHRQGNTGKQLGNQDSQNQSWISLQVISAARHRLRNLSALMGATLLVHCVLQSLQSKIRFSQWRRPLTSSVLHCSSEPPLSI